jgi:hypothetical protein
VAGGSLYLQIAVNGETLVPRQRLVAVPYAIRAESAASAETVGGFDAGYLTQIVHNFAFDGSAPANDDPLEGLADVDGDGLANFIDPDNDDDGQSDSSELAAGTNLNVITPTISALSPTTGEATTTTPVAFTGTNFEPSMTVTFGSQTPTPQNLTSTSFTVNVGPQPVGTVAARVTRTNGEFAEKNFTFAETLIGITSMSPASLNFQQSGVVAVTGFGFQPGITVTLGSESPTPQNVTATSFQVTVGPQSTGAKPVLVTLGAREATATFEFVDPSLSRKVFATSTGQNGNLGGIAGGDDLCAALAAEASLPGTYKAWLADSTGSPNTSFTRGAAYYLVDGTTRVAQSYADLTDGTIENAISKNELGNTFGGAGVWTNVASGGGAQASHCQNWSSASGSITGGTGQALNTNSGWTSQGTATCNSNRLLFCFQQ